MLGAKKNETIKGPHEYSIIGSIFLLVSSVRLWLSAPFIPSPPRNHRDTEKWTITREGSYPSGRNDSATRAAGDNHGIIESASTAPSQWQTEDSWRQWLRTKAEEDRRRQEEERTRQETLKLEQRRIERSMLHDAVQAGVPPQLVPFIFIGIGGGNLARSSLDVAQHLDLSSVQQAEPQQLQKPVPLSQQQAIPAQATFRDPSNLDLDPSQYPPPDIRRDSRIPPNPYASQVAPSPPQHGPASPSRTQGYRASLQPTRLHVGGDSQSHQPRLNTNVFHVSPAQFQYGATGPSHGAASAPAPTKHEAQSGQSPSIYFHHWTPPNQAQPSPPSTRGRQESSSRFNLHSESQITSPGRKRKAQRSHPPPPPPTSHHEQISPALSTASPSRGTSAQLRQNPSHFRQQSDPSHGLRHVESNADNVQRYPPDRKSFLNPLELSSRTSETDVQPGSAHATSERGALKCGPPSFL